MDRPPLEVADLVRAAGDAFIERSRKWISWKQANGSVRANKFPPTCRGIGDGMQARGTTRNTGSPSGDRGMDQLATRERQAGRLGCTNRSACSVPSDGARESMVSCKGWEEKNAGEYGSVEENRAGVECGPGIPGEELSSKDIGDLELRVLV